MLYTTSAALDFFPGEEFLTQSLQNQLCLMIDDRQVKRGRLLHFKKHHFCIVLTLLTPKDNTENTEIPLPFIVEEHHEDQKVMAYFDYRVKNIIPNCSNNENLDKILCNYSIKNQYFNKILEIITL